ncbi:hypothetical protein GQ53DRAFT_836804 [Thozetella sp. PMI_491]|nr:hypothetical protein GQ53DRAFT_836804 [Thozetella sp. PMI_491]
MRPSSLWSCLAWAMAFNAAECSPSNIALDHARDIIVATRDESPTLGNVARQGAAWDLVGPSLGRRDVNYTSHKMLLDTTWKDATLYQYSFSKPGGNNVTLGAGVQIICKDCYIKGTFQATLIVNGSTDLLESFVDYGKNATSSVEKIVTEALGPLESSLTKGAQDLLNATNAVETLVHDAIADAVDEIVVVFDINTDLFRSAISKAFGIAEDFIKQETAKVDGLITNLKDEIENVTENAFLEFKSDLDSSIKNIPGLGGLVDKVENITETAVDFVKNGLEKGMKKIAEGLNIGSYGFPTLNVDFNLPSLPSMPAVGLHFELDGLELYMDLDLILSASATYSLPLFRSESEIGVGNQAGFAGVVLAIDLLLDVHAEIDISSGFHLKMDDTVNIDLELFSKEISHLNFPGAQIEFLPVTVRGGNTIIKGVLTVTLESGWQLQQQNFSILGENLAFGAGVNEKIFANVAYFTTNITSTPSLHEGDCELSVEEYFEFNLGAAIGATVAVNNHTWGPNPGTTVPVFYTTLASVCALTALAETTASSSLPAQTSATGARARGILPRQDLTTTTLSSTVIFTGRSCASSGLINCPASLQITQTSSSVTSFVTAVAPGVTPTFPVFSVNSVPNPSPFGTNAKSAAASSGVPTSYDPSATTGSASASSGTANSAPTDGVSGFVNGETGGVSNKVILGVSIGLGVPVLLAIIGAAIWLWRRGGFRGVRYSPVAKKEATAPVETAYSHDDTGSQEASKKAPLVSAVPVGDSTS